MIPIGRAPYPGLRAYRSDESILFFGRDGCVDEMVDKLAAARFLAVLGTSGSGKSSLVRTGLLEALSLGLHPAGTSWMIADCHPGGRPLHNLARGLLAARGAERPEPDVLDLLETFLRRGPRSVSLWAEANIPRGQNLLIIVDQFEELFRYVDHAGRERAEGFVALLLECARSSAPVHVVITMRSEYLGACALIPGLAEQINRGLYLTRRMTREECRQAIEGPAGIVGFEIEPRLTARILNDLSSFAPWDSERDDSQLERLSRQADQLPLMQHALSRLWHLAGRRDADGPIRLTLGDYEAIGELRGALDQHGDEVVAALPDDARPLVRPVFRALVSGTNLSDAVRKPTRLRELVAIVGAPRERVAGIVEAFRDAGCSFLRPPPQQPLEDDTVVDISHESLIRQWSSLSGWLAEEARADSMWARLTDAQARHAAAEGELLTGADLATALDWWTREQPTQAWARAHGGRIETISAFLDASRQGAEAARAAEEQRLLREKRQLEEQLERDRLQREKDQSANRRLRAALGAAVVSMLVAMGGAAFSYLQFQEAKRQTARAEDSETVALNASQEAERQRVAAVEAQAQAEAANQGLAQAAELAEAERRNATEYASAAFKSLEDEVIGENERRIFAPGNALAEVERSLTNGRARLESETFRKADPQRSALNAIRIDIRSGMIARETGRFEQALAAFRAAGQRLREMSLAGPQPPLAIVERAMASRLEAEALAGMERLDEALAAAERALATLERTGPAEAIDIELERSHARGVLADILSRRGDHGPAAVTASACLEGLAQAEGTDRLLARARCELVAARLSASPPEARAAAIDGMMASLDAIPQPGRSVPARIVYARLAAERGDIAARQGDLDLEHDHLLRAYKAVDLGADDRKQRVDLRAVIGDIEARRARNYLDRGRRSNAEEASVAYGLGLDRAKAGIEMILLGAGSGEPDDWTATPEIARTYEFLLNMQVELVLGLDRWRDDLNGISDLMKAANRRVVALRVVAPDCPTCIMGAYRSLLVPLVALGRHAPSDVVADHPVDILRDPDRWYGLLRGVLAYFEQQGQASHAEQTVAASARNHWHAVVLGQFEGQADLPDLKVNQLIQKLDDARKFAQAYLDANPGAWQVERKIGRIHHALAMAYDSVGNQTDALKSARAGADHLSRDAIALLAQWYRDGTGPVAADEALARGYESRLDSRSWGVAPIDVTVDYLWTERDDARRTTIQIEDAVGPQDDVVARLVDQARDMEGIVVSDADRQKLEAVLGDARASGDSFLERAKLAMSPIPNSPDWIARQAEPYLRTYDRRQLIQLALDQDKKSGGIRAFLEAVRVIVERSNDASVSANVLEFARDRLADRTWADVSEALFTTLIDRGRLDTAQLASAYGGRAAARENLRSPDRLGAQSDRLIAIALFPNDASRLNSLAYDWAVEERDLRASIALLRRAVQEAPDDPHIRDSLGWAHVQAGELDEGRRLLESAASHPDLQQASPARGELLAHLAEIHRRQGRESLARQMFAEALGLATDAPTQSFIISRQQLLTDVEGVARDHVLAAAGLLRGAAAAKRIGWSTDEIGVAIRGFDTVAYFELGRPELGRIEHAALWNEALWLFSSADHLAKFKADPARYAPAYGGFCALCVASNHKLHSNPVAWAIHKDKLYLHFSLAYRDSWRGSPDRAIAQADDLWGELSKKVTDPDARSAFSSSIAEVLAQKP